MKIFEEIRGRSLFTDGGGGRCLGGEGHKNQVHFLGEGHKIPTEN